MAIFWKKLQLQISRWMMKMEAKRWIPWTRFLTSMPCEKPCYLANFHGRFFWREWFDSMLRKFRFWCFLYQKKSFKFWAFLLSSIWCFIFFGVWKKNRKVSWERRSAPWGPTWWGFFATRKRPLGVKIQSGKLVCHGCWRPPSPPTARYGWGKGQIIGSQHPWTIDIWCIYIYISSTI